jgi:hypothetical protein
MKGKGVLIVALLAALVLVVTTTALASGKDELAKVRKATAKYRSIEVAQGNGYDLVPGLDHCFDNPGVGAMGYHYIKTSALDLTVDAMQPEAMVYAPKKNGKLKLAAVEYIVPAGPWDEAGNDMPPALFGRHFHLNEALGVYVLHAWIWQKNPAGIFEDWNPNVSCP